MDDYFRKSKRRPSLAHRAFPGRQVPVRPAPRAPVPSPAPAPAQAQRAARAPRKRFRKKVTGLFGDQTDLQKRMQKLLRELPADILTRKPTKAHVTDTSPAHPYRTPSERDSFVNNAELRSVVEKIDVLKTVSTSTPNGHGAEKTQGATENARKENGRMVSVDRDDPPTENFASRSIGKWRLFQNRMGRLSPRSNDMFLDELDVGTPSPESVRPMSRLGFDGKEIEPPKLPKLDNFRTGSRRTAFSRTQSLDRTGTPAMLRRKVRRNERGYRGADVLRMRMSQVVEPPHDVPRSAHARDEGITPAMDSRRRVDGLGTYVQSVSNEKFLDNIAASEGAPVRRRTRSEMAEPPKKSAATKRRRVASDADKYPSNSELRDHDPFALLIEAAEKESVQVQRPRADEGSDLPPRKSKRLRSSGVMDNGPERWDRRRHTAHGALSEAEQVRNEDEDMPPASGSSSRGNGPAQGLRFRTRRTETDGRARAETGTIGQRRGRSEAFPEDEAGSKGVPDAVDSGTEDDNGPASSRGGGRRKGRR